MITDTSTAAAKKRALDPRDHDGLSDEQRRRKDRIDVAQILALPDGPWEFLGGCPTAAQWGADMRFADSQQPWNQPEKARTKSKRQAPRGGECVIK